jgi:hypothetical protein
MSTLASTTFGLHSWASLMPGSPPRLYIRGAMHVRNVTDTVVLSPVASDPAHPSIRRFRVVVEQGSIGLPALGIATIAYEEDYSNQYNAIELIFSDSSKALIDTIEIAQ